MNDYFGVIKNLKMNKTNVKNSYNSWADQYDTNINKTRDLESIALQKTLFCKDFNSCLEIGCGTGKNTGWLLQRTNFLIGIDISEEMLRKAKEKISSPNVEFKLADITQPWSFTDKLFDLVSFSLVLEHISNLDFVFAEACKTLKPGGFIYLGELHPYKQYTGSKARFETEEGLQVVDCFNHSVSEFIQVGFSNKLQLVDLQEHFDEDENISIPRILTMLFQKPKVW